MIRKAVRVTLWIIKGVLLLVAVVALVAWPWSYRHPGERRGHRWITGAAQVDIVAVGGGWENGRVGVEWDDKRYTGELLHVARKRAHASGEGWTWRALNGGPVWTVFDEGRSWGPFRWLYHQSVSRRTCGVSVPCWLLALAAGAWPLVSIAVVARRRRRLRRRGCCRQCGYDLRATPGRCPECGAVPSPAR